MTDQTEDLSRRTAKDLSPEQRMRATDAVVGEIGRMRTAWGKLRFFEEQWPDLPVGNSWDTIRRIHDEMGAMIEGWKKQDG